MSMTIVQTKNFTAVFSSPFLHYPDYAKRIIWEEFHRGAEKLKDEEIGRIEKRTPKDTGTLRKSGSGRAYTKDTQSDLLVSLYPRAAPQIQVNRREYAPYQEGGKLGIKTYTNPPRLMYAKVLEDDIPEIEKWAKEQADRALKRIVSLSP